MLCHHFNCLFVHIPKAAGQSVEQVFIKALGLTWETRAPLLLRTNDNILLGPKSLAHLTAQEYTDMKYMTPEQFSRYFKFSFVRNPYERLVSTYIYFDYIKKFDFKHFLDTIVSNNLDERSTRHFLPQHNYIYDKNGSILVDYVGRFENLQNDFNHVCGCIGMPNTILPHANKTKSNNKNLGTLRMVKKLAKDLYSWKSQQRHRSRYMDYYDEESFALVNNLYEADFRLFGYEMLK